MVTKTVNLQEHLALAELRFPRVLDRADRVVDQRAQAIVNACGLEYGAAVHAVLSSDLKLRDARPATVQAAQGIPAGVELDRRVRALTQENPRIGYADAMRRVLDIDPALKARYTGVQS